MRIAISMHSTIESAASCNELTNEKKAHRGHWCEPRLTPALTTLLFIASIRLLRKYWYAYGRYYQMFEEL